jgi:hypothetical protein
MQWGDLFDRIWWRRRIVDHLIAPAHSIYYSDTGTNLLKHDWDNLIILDACRADLFEQVAPVESFTEYRREQSLGSFTGEWARETFNSGSYGDTVYVTANPYSSSIAADSLHEIVEVWHESFDEELQTVPPGAVVDAAKDVFNRHQNKRIIVHFMQPHHPFVTAESITEISDWTIEKAASSGASVERPKSPFEALEMGILNRGEVWRAYKENLQYVLEEVDTLLDELSGKTVITSDHGNLLGERAWPIPMRLYGHPGGIRTPELVTVPYAIIGDNRRNIIEGNVRSQSEADQATINERLRQLGYRE